MRSPVYVVVAAVQLVVSACGNPTDPSRFEFTCERNADCADGFVCRRSVCVAVEPFVRDAGGFDSGVGGGTGGGGAGGGTGGGAGGGGGSGFCGGCRTAAGQCVLTPSLSTCGLNGVMCSACTGDELCVSGACVSADGGVDAGSRPDAGAPDAGTGVDAGADAGVDAGVDAGLDAGTLDAGAGLDAGRAVDAGAVVDAGPQLPFDGGSPPAGCVASGWCWYSPTPFGFSSCRAAALTADAGYVVIDSVLYRVTAQGVALVGSGVPSSVDTIRALNSSSLLISTSPGQPFVRFTEGQAPIDLFTLPTATPYLTLTRGGDPWGSDSVSQISWYDTTVQGWSLVSPPEVDFFWQQSAPINASQGYFSYTPDDYSVTHVYFFDAGQWTYLTDAGTCLAGNEPGFVYLTTEEEVFRMTPSGPVQLSPPVPSNGQCIVHHVGNELYTLGSTLQVYSNDEWTTVFTPPGQVSALSMAGDGGLACGPNWIYRSTGEGWSSLFPPPKLPLGSSLSARSVAVAGDGAGYLIQSNGSVWRADGAAAQQVTALSGSAQMVPFSPDEYLVNYYDGTFRRFDGGAVGPVMPTAFSRSSVSVAALAAESPSTAWAVGQMQGVASPRPSVVLYFDGGTWALVPHPSLSNQRIRAVASAGGSTWIGVHDRLYQWDGDGGWLDAGTPAPGQPFEWLGALSSTALLAANNNGIFGWTRDGGWYSELSAGTIYAVAVDSFAGTAAAITFDSSAVYVRRGRSDWRFETLPSNLGYSGYLKLGIRGSRIWVLGENSTVVWKP